MIHSPDECVHCPHCDHHICTWGEIQAAIKKVGGEVPEGGWSVCERCCEPIHIKPNGEHVAPKKGQIEALSYLMKAEVMRSVFIVKTIHEATHHGLMVSFTPMEGFDRRTSEPIPAHAVKGSSLLH